MKKQGRAKHAEGAQERQEDRELIAHGSVSRIERCGCGSLYLTLGPVTMAVHPEAMRDLGETLARAVVILNGDLAAAEAAERRVEGEGDAEGERPQEGPTGGRPPLN